MKSIKLMSLSAAALFMTAICMPSSSEAQKSDKQKLEVEAAKSKAAFVKSDAGMANLFKNAYGYAIFPNIGKGALGIGGAGGKGIVYESGKAIGKAKMVQITVGAQAGGQAYREVIFFETKDALDRFKGDKLEMSGQMSAVAAKAGASANAKYTDGVLVFTEERGGLMLEASIGGQKFTYKPY